MSALITLVVVLLILGVLWWAAQKILAVMPIAEPFRTVIMVVLVVIAVFIVVDLLLGLTGSGSAFSGFRGWRMCS
jgi:hypothetical protein